MMMMKMMILKILMLFKSSDDNSDSDDEKNDFNNFGDQKADDEKSSNQDGDTKDGEKQDDKKGKEESTHYGPGAGGDFSKGKLLKAVTQDAFDNKHTELLDDTIKGFVYVNFQNLITKIV